MIKIIMLLFFAWLPVAAVFSQSVGIGTGTPNASAKLDVSSSTQGMLLPRMTSAQRKAIVNPEPGLLVFDTDKRTIFMYEIPDWLQLTFIKTAQVEPSVSTVSDGQPGDSLGVSVSISGDYVAAGASGDDVGANVDQGSVYIFHRINGTWMQEAKLVANDGAAGDNFGNAVALDGDYLIVGAVNNDNGASNRGAAYIFLRSGASWTQQVKLLSPDGIANDHFGYAVDMDNDQVIVGSPHHDIAPNTNQGAAYIFTRSGITWPLTKKLIATNGELNDQLGTSVGISGVYAVVGSPYHDSPTLWDKGAAYVFWGAALPAWSHVQTLVDGLVNTSNTQTGRYASIDGNYIVLGSAYSCSAFTRGAFNLWNQEAFEGGTIPSNSSQYVFLGFPTAIYGSNVAQGVGSLFKRNVSGTGWEYFRLVYDFTGVAYGFFGRGSAVDGFNLVAGAPGKNNYTGELQFLNFE